MASDLLRVIKMLDNDVGHVILTSENRSRLLYECMKFTALEETSSIVLSEHRNTIATSNKMDTDLTAPGDDAENLDSHLQ